MPQSVSCTCDDENGYHTLVVQMQSSPSGCVEKHHKKHFLYLSPLSLGPVYLFLIIFSGSQVFVELILCTRRLVFIRSWPLLLLRQSLVCIKLKMILLLCGPHHSAVIFCCPIRWKQKWVLTLLWGSAANSGKQQKWAIWFHKPWLSWWKQAVQGVAESVTSD